MACSLAPEVLVRGVLEYDLISTPLDANGLSNAKISCTAGCDVGLSR
jgi:hypothetical protein